jgi:hypothetical protein
MGAADGEARLIFEGLPQKQLLPKAEVAIDVFHHSQLLQHSQRVSHYFCTELLQFGIAIEHSPKHCLLISVDEILSRNWLSPGVDCPLVSVVRYVIDVMLQNTHIFALPYS